MDLMQFLWKSVLTNLRHAGLVFLPLFLLGCAPTTTKSEVIETDNRAQTGKVGDVEDESAEVDNQPTLPMSPELMYYILTAEVAGQRGEVGIAVDLYQRAAQMVDSPALASRSAQIATLTRDEQRINRALERWAEVAPNEADVYIMRAPFLMMEQDYDGVVKALNKGLALAPEQRHNYLLRISENLIEIASPEQALNTLRQLDLYKQHDPEVRFTYARMAFFYKQHDVALAELEPLLKAEPKNEDYLILKADVLQRQGRTDEGLKLISKAAQREDASDEMRFAYGKLLGDSGQTVKARELFEEMHLQNPENRDVLFALGLLGLEDKDGQLAKSYFADLLKLGDPSYQVAYFMGMAEELNNNIDAALVWYAAVPVHSHRFDQAQTQYLNLLISRGDILKARQHLIGLRNDLPEQAEKFYLFEASMLRESGNNETAYKVLTEALTKFPASFDVLYSRAMVAESLGKIDILEQDLRAILDLDPNNAQALNALGYTLTDRTDRHQEALQMINRALELKPGDPFYLDSLGWVYYRLGELDKAEQYLREAVEVQPDAEFIAHLGEVLWVKGEKEEARRIWKKGLQQNADNKLLLDTMRRLDQ